MALRGTLKDFGIADIFQLIGHQGKTGVLHLSSKDQKVHIYFQDGTIIRAEHDISNQSEMLGQLMSRAGVLNDDQVKDTMQAQKTTLKRIGDILVEKGYTERQTVQEFTRLQTTETMYKLFLWSSGTYEFEASDVESDPDLAPIRAEAVLMDGFRMVDEWPMVRKVITGYDLTFEKVKELDAQEPAAEAPADSDGLDDLDFGDFGEDDFGGGSPTSSVGKNERSVFGLVAQDRDVQKIIDLSRLGEFETCKALYNLVEDGYLKIARGRHRPSSPSTVGAIDAKRHVPIWPIVSRVAVYALLIAGVLVAVKVSQTSRLVDFSAPRFVDYRPVALEATVGQVQMERIRAALDTYFLIFGNYPVRLEQLVDAGFLRAEDLRYPWKGTYYYRRTGAKPARSWLNPTPTRPFILMPPIR